MSIQHMQTVFDAGDLTAPQKSVLLAYCNFTDAHGYCWPGVERIADMTGLSLSGVKKVRKQLAASGLMNTVSRGKKGGGRKTNGSRINIKRLEKMKLPPREYDDNLVAELGFEEDHEPEAKVPDGHTNGSREAQQRYPGGTNEGACGDPYPSVDPVVDPSGDPSSSASEPVEPPAPAAEAPAPKKTKKPSPEQIVQERTDATQDEARAVVQLVLAQAAADGTQVRVPYRWLEDRDHHVLAQDLATVRRPSKPAMQTCGLHNVLLEQRGGCSSCYGDLKAGDTERVREHLAEVGADARPDLAAVLGAPQTAVGGSSGEWTWEAQMRAERRARNGYVGGTRSATITSEETEALAELTNEERRDAIMGWGPPKLRARQPAYTAFTNPTSPNAYTEEW